MKGSLNRSYTLALGVAAAVSAIVVGMLASEPAHRQANIARAGADVHAPAALPRALPAATQNQSDVYIVQAHDIDTARAAVLSVGGTVMRELDIVNAVGAHLPAGALQRLQARADLHTVANTRMTTSSKRVSKHASLSTTTSPTSTSTTTPSAAATPSTALSTTTATTAALTTTSGEGPANVAYPALIEANRELADGVDGSGVTVAILDTGFTATDGLQLDRNKQARVVAGFDAIHNQPTLAPIDGYGHGTHLAGIILNSQLANDGTQTGIAPNAKLVAVKAFADDGSATYLDVLTGMDWILKNRTTYNIRVLNLSFSAAPSSHYWDDPVDQAVMKLWQSGIVVVAAAGNDGPTAMTVGAPGNTPYIITVGAMTDNFTPNDPSDDHLASFSSAGPTIEGFVKPDVVAPGGHIVSLMKRNTSLIAKLHPEFQVDDNYFRMSGTSQSTAVVTGVVALMLQQKPWLTPDDVKCQLMSSANQAVDGSNNLQYSIFQQGAGLVNARRAVASSVQGCANRGLDIAADIAGTAHFGGLAQQDTNGNYYLVGVDGYLWSRTDLFATGFLWSRSTLDTATTWSAGTMWSDSYLWSRSISFNTVSLANGSNITSYLWSRSTGINHWAPQE